MCAGSIRQMRIEILGPGCVRCERLTENVQQALKELNIEAEVTKVTDLKEILRYGLMLTPGLVVNGRVRAAGQVLSPKQIVELLTQEER